DPQGRPAGRRGGRRRHARGTHLPLLGPLPLLRRRRRLRAGTHLHPRRALLPAALGRGSRARRRRGILGRAGLLRDHPLTHDLSRRDFLAASALAPFAAATRAPRGAPAVIIPPDARPCVVASANGLRGVGRAYELMMRGTDTLDAAVEGVKIQELDPEDNTVG